ncbi:MAG: PSD1 and planctomycete cytochrome C domain-containing protein [Planctomycetota bacterium]|nr:PSD1 and planctomycete cytochrome C domain-containing protein [Planctomycetota bacterium]
MVPGEPLGRDVRVTHILATIRPSVKRYFRNIWPVAMRIAFQILFGFLLFSAAINRGIAGEETVDFSQRIRPILSDACYQCHGPDEKERQAGLRIDQRESLLASRDTRPAIVPGNHSESEIFHRITSNDPEMRMPPPDAVRQLTAEEIELLKAWIDQGADWEKLWSLQPVRAVEPPSVQQQEWPRSTLDRFVLANLERQGLTPSEEASRETLIRRVTLDLTGLPPTLAEIDAFIADTSEDAYEKVVERLLASPHYGERMAVDWLDAARFADTHGYHVDSQREMWRWRDWVIDAFNRNMPFDQFTVEQLAGDLLPEPTESNRIASGFNRNHGINFEGGAFAEEFRVEYVVDRVHTTATIFMGLTLKCARCHDHKFDPLSQKDYYRFFAFFNSVPERGIDGAIGNAVPLMRFPSGKQRRALEALNTSLTARQREVEAYRKQSDKKVAAWAQKRKTEVADAVNENGNSDPIDAIIKLEATERTDAQEKELIEAFLAQDKTYQDLKSAAKQAERKRDNFENKIPSTMVMRDSEKMRGTYLLNRGLYDQPGEQVTAGVPAIFPQLPQNAVGNRLSLARWLVSGSHPLTARVTVNRFWQSLFGNGIVKTSENFGTQGSLPSHAALLDWLADRFVRSGWDVKDLMRLLVTSATYRQNSKITEESFQRDPENRLLARGPRLRLQAEMIRDASLAASGLLVRSVGGASVRPYQPEGLWEEVAFGIKTYGAQEYEQDHGDALYRRSMYTFWKRSCPPPSMVTFDAPDRETCTVRRERTNTPLQALVLLNDPTYVETARGLAERTMHEGGNSNNERITYAFRIVTGRRPTAAESAILLEEFNQRFAAFKIDPQTATQLLSVGDSEADSDLPTEELAAWTMVARLLFNLDEAITKS